jgi:hypothetical protein
MRLCRVTLTNSRNRSSFNKLLLISTFQEFRTRFEQSKAIERLERLERIGPRGERSKAIERLERLERLEPATASLMSDVPGDQGGRWRLARGIASLLERLFQSQKATAKRFNDAVLQNHIEESRPCTGRTRCSRNGKRQLSEIIHAQADSSLPPGSYSSTEPRPSAFIVAFVK